MKKKQKLRTWNVTLPISGRICVTVAAADEQSDQDVRGVV